MNDVTLQVMKKVHEICCDDEEANRDHEDHMIFGYEQDEQLLLWLNRSVMCLYMYIIRVYTRKHFLSLLLDIHVRMMVVTRLCLLLAGGLTTGRCRGAAVGRSSAGATTTAVSWAASTGRR